MRRKIEYCDQDVFDLCDEIDRLRTKSKPQGKTVRVRMACVWSYADKQWVCHGESNHTPEESRRFVNANTMRPYMIVTADLPILEETEIEAEVDNGRP